MKFTLTVSFCDPGFYLPLAQAADASGFDAICVADGLFWFDEIREKYPYTKDGERWWGPEMPFLDPWAVIPAMAAVTQRIHFYTNVMKFPVRHPLLLAKSITTAAVLSGGRVGLGVGLSPWPEDYEVCGERWERRGPRSAEMIEIIREVASGALVEHEGEFYRFPKLQIAPVPKQPIPIYVGGHAEGALRRAARIADGWISANVTSKELAPLVERVRALRAELGPKDAPFEVKGLAIDVHDLDGFRRLRDMGITDAVVWPWHFYGGNANDLGHRIDVVRRFTDDVIEKLREEGA